MTELSLRTQRMGGVIEVFDLIEQVRRVAGHSALLHLQFSAHDVSKTPLPHVAYSFSGGRRRASEQARSAMT